MRASEKTRRLTGLALMTAIIVVLQVVASFVKFGPFPITLALAPIIIGAALYGPKAGAYLGGVFGIVVLLACILGWDSGGSILWNANPFLTAVICLGKGILSGLCAGLVYRAVAGSGRSHGRMLGGSILAGIVSPVVNTGLFCLCLTLLFHDILLSWAGGTEVIYYILFVLTGINFLVELAVNLVLSTVIVRVVGARMHA
ncbi:ECF transporter S component [uncultured Flavonifractor sp.]|uniref:ECF transporter S component n=1 Tax=uncultured Flavonifractor sp. TaxID=1193534 RepID=UPI0026273CEF|nr:ECF transporter S component [uncultured Flavonifractor sp.]